MNRATADNQSAQAEEEGLEPTKEWVKDLIDEIVAEEFASPDLELHWLAEDEADPETVLEGRLKVGALTLNEMRDALGLYPYDNAAADRPMVLTATGFVPIEANAGGQGLNASGQSALDVQKYSSAQPRVPAGNLDGGQWAREDADVAAANSQVVADSARDTPPPSESTSAINDERGEHDDARLVSDVSPEWIAGAQYAVGWEHHYMPWANFKNYPLQDATRQVFVDATSGPLADITANRWSPEHAAYNSAVDELFKEFLERNNISLEHTELLTPEKADEFIDEIFFSRDPRIRSFNRRIWSEAFRYWRRSRGGRGDPD
jgi:hypothetical protein